MRSRSYKRCCLVLKRLFALTGYFLGTFVCPNSFHYYLNFDPLNSKGKLEWPLCKVCPVVFHPWCSQVCCGALTPFDLSLCNFCWRMVILSPQPPTKYDPQPMIKVYASILGDKSIIPTTTHDHNPQPITIRTAFLYIFINLFKMVRFWLNKNKNFQNF